MLIVFPVTLFAGALGTTGTADLEATRGRLPFATAEGRMGAFGGTAVLGGVGLAEAGVGGTDDCLPLACAVLTGAGLAVDVAVVAGCLPAAVETGCFAEGRPLMGDAVRAGTGCRVAVGLGDLTPAVFTAGRGTCRV